MKYDPTIQPGGQLWLDCVEVDRIEAITEYHQKADATFGDDLNLHSVSHQVVENQIALDVSPVPETLVKLIRQGSVVS